jgi:hypothetical protein
MISEIDSVISLLDHDIDLLLISLLEQKKSTKTLIANFEINAYTRKRVIDDCENTIHETCMEELQKSEYYSKIVKISGKDCRTCKHSVRQVMYFKSGDVEYQSRNKDRLGCNQCVSRCGDLELYADSIRKQKYEQMKKVITEELIETKCLISIINKKIKQLKQTK